MSLKSKIDAIFAPWDTRQSPGMAIAVKYNGEIIHKRGYGMADLDHDIEISTDTVFHVASVAKQFTAMCIVLLSQQLDTNGNPLIMLDDKLGKYIPDKLPEKFQSITIRQMLHHTSGIRDMLRLTTLAGWRWGDDVITRTDVLGLVRRMDTTEFDPPGSAFSYSNTNYLLAGEIVHKVSKMPLSKFARTNIFEPLGMKSTQIVDTYGEIVKNRAYGYRGSSPPFEKRMPNYNLSGPTNLLTTVEDLLRWDKNFDSKKVGREEGISELLTLDDSNSGYGLGLYIVTDAQGKPGEIYHNGKTMGHRAKLYRSNDPEDRLTIALLCNIELRRRADGEDVDELVDRVADAVLGSGLPRGPEPVRAPTVPSVPLPSKPTDYIGRYRSDEIDTEYEVLLVGNTLNIVRYKRDPAPLSPIEGGKEGDKFRIKPFADSILETIEITFERDDNDNVTRFFVDDATGRDLLRKFPFRKLPKRDP